MVVRKMNTDSIDPNIVSVPFDKTDIYCFNLFCLVVVL